MKASPGYPIPHKSLAVGWGFREAWQNCCIKQEQTSHTFLSVSYVKVSGRQNLFTWNTVAAFFPMHFLKKTEIWYLIISLSFLLKCLFCTCSLGFFKYFFSSIPNATHFKDFRCTPLVEKWGTLCSKMLTDFRRPQSSLWSDSERMRAARCQKAVNYTCGGQIRARHCGRWG